MNKFRIMSVFVFLAMVFGFAQVSPVAATGPIGHWSLDDITGSTYAADLSGNGNDGICGGNMSIGSTTRTINCPAFGVVGQIGTSADFNGSTEALRVNNTIPGSYTVTAWFKTTATGLGGQGSPAFFGQGIIWSDWPGSAADAISMSLTGGYLAFGTGENGGVSYNTLASTVVVNTGEWVCAAVTRDMNTGVKQLYINGQLDGTNSAGGTGLLDRNPYIVFGANPLDYRYFDGQIDEISFYDRVLSASEIQGNCAIPNAPPTAVAGGPYLVAVESSIAFNGSGSTDPDGDALTETWTADGGTVSGSTYTAGSVPGIYDVTLVVNDGKENSQPSTTIVVVYDPSGGFVTGGGWIDSPPGAYIPDGLTVFEANFDSGTPTEFSGSTTTEDVQGYAGLGTGSNVFGGDFLRNDTVPAATTTLTLTNLPPHDSISLSFLLAVIDSWDGASGTCFATGDGFNVSVDGTTIFSEAFENSTCGVQTYIPPVGVELARRANLGFNTAPTFYSDSAYDMGLDPTFQNIPHTSSTLTVEWFTSGGGWQGGTDESWAIDNVQVAIDSDITGKATFGFVSKYKKGANVPTGNTEFQFQAAGFNFHSDTYEWLVVNQGGANAQFKGEGTVNGALDPNGNAYKFMLWAGDGSPDTFRIKIWSELAGVETVVYDNGTDQAIGGGSIVIHQK